MFDIYKKNHPSTHFTVLHFDFSLSLTPLSQNPNHTNLSKLEVFSLKIIAFEG